MQHGESCSRCIINRRFQRFLSLIQFQFNLQFAAVVLKFIGSDVSSYFFFFFFYFLFFLNQTLRLRTCSRDNLYNLHLADIFFKS